MQNIVSTRVHDEIIGLLDRATSGVVLVSPFVRMWPELRRAIARAVARGVNVSLITRGPKGGPREEDLAIFYELDAEVREVPGLHLKAYLSEKEALYTSVNLTRESIDRSLDSTLLFDRVADAEGWKNVFEVWNKALDDAYRADETPEPDFSRLLLVPPRTRADEGDPSARTCHRYCISCGATASEEADEVVCLRCRAAAIAEDRDPDAIAGTRCARCNAPYRRATVERPYCAQCYRAEQELLERRPACWYVSGSPGAIEVWSAIGAERGLPRLVKNASRAVARRWAVMLPDGGWLSAAVTAVTPKPLTLWEAAMPPEGIELGRSAGILLERLPTRVLPACRDLRGFAPERGFHISYSESDSRPGPTHWAHAERLAAWAVKLPTSTDPSKVWTPDWVWRVLLQPRKGFSEDAVHDPSRTHLAVDLELTVPEALRPQWRKAVSFLLQVVLSALHSYSEQDVRDWLAQAEPRARDSIATALGRPAPFGPVAMVRDGKGRVHDLPSRTDRVVVLRVGVVDGEGWALKGGVFKATKALIH